MASKKNEPPQVYTWVRLGFWPQIKKYWKGKNCRLYFSWSFCKNRDKHMPAMEYTRLIPCPCTGWDVSRSFLPYSSRILKTTSKKVLVLGDTEPVVNCIIQHSDFTNENQHNQHYRWSRLNSELPCFSGISQTHNGPLNIFFFCG